MQCTRSECSFEEENLAPVEENPITVVLRLATLHATGTSPFSVKPDGKRLTKRLPRRRLRVHLPQLSSSAAQRSQKAGNHVGT